MHNKKNYIKILSIQMQILFNTNDNIWAMQYIDDNTQKQQTIKKIQKYCNKSDSIEINYYEYNDKMNDIVDDIINIMNTKKIKMMIMSECIIYETKNSFSKQIITMRIRQLTCCYFCKMNSVKKMKHNIRIKLDEFQSNKCTTHNLEFLYVKYLCYIEATNIQTIIMKYTKQNNKAEQINRQLIGIYHNEYEIQFNMQILIVKDITMIQMKQLLKNLAKIKMSDKNEIMIKCHELYHPSMKNKINNIMKKISQYKEIHLIKIPVVTV